MTDPDLFDAVDLELLPEENLLEVDVEPLPQKLKIDLNLTDTEIAQPPGLFEGLGSFSIDQRSKARYAKSTAPGVPVIQLTSTDEDVIMKVGSLLNKNYCKPVQREGRKRTYKISIGDRATLYYFLTNILPYMSERRTDQIQKIIDEIDAWKVWDKEGGTNAAARFGGFQKAKNRKERSKEEE